MSGGSQEELHSLGTGFWEGPDGGERFGFGAHQLQKPAGPCSRVSGFSASNAFGSRVSAR